MARDPGTYDGVRSKYDEWSEIDAQRPRPKRKRPASAPVYMEPQRSSDMSKWILTAIGAGIGLLLVLLALVAFWTAAKWQGYARDGAYIGYMIVGIFLTIAGVGGIIATWYHNFRVLTRPPAPHH